jgi:hypothetical protein
VSRGWAALGTAIGVAGIGGALLYSRRASAASLPSADPPPTPTDALPGPGEVAGDLLRNWGETPADLRALFMFMEEVSRIEGSSRVFAVIAYRESRFVTTAHNGNELPEQDERDSSRRAYDNNKGRNPPLAYGEQAADFGSGGLFGQLAPYFLWTGVPELGKKAPLLGARPELLFQPRAAAFGAVVYLQRLLAHYRVDDLADIKAGWANPGLLGKDRGSATYRDVRARFLADAQALGIDLGDTSTVPAKLSAAAWPGVAAVFAGLVGALPKEVT